MTEMSYRRSPEVNNGAAHSTTNGVHLTGYRKGLESTPQTSASHHVGHGQSQLSRGSWFVKLSACTAAGVVFGFAAEKAKGQYPQLE